MKKIIPMVLFVLFATTTRAQVKTKIYETGLPNSRITNTTARAAAYKVEAPTVFEKLISNPMSNDVDAREYKDKFAVPIDVNIDMIKTATQWEEDGFMMYALSLKAGKAVNLSAQFSKFFLTENAILSIFNNYELTDSITAKENNVNNIWATRIYQGGQLNLLLKKPISDKGACALTISTIGLGYKQVGGNFFGVSGASAACNINVVCPEGNGWNNERNAVALIVSNSSELCTGTLIMNTCGNNIPYLLTANHCLNGNVQNWVFQFQTWSSTCTPNGTFRQDVQFNGCQLRANDAATDFALVQLNQTPASNSGITYAGWNRGAAAATRTTSLHHPRGDLMKVANDLQAPVSVPFGGGASNHWRATFDQGIVQHGSSGAALFDQNRRIVGQLHGNQNNVCVNSADFTCWCVTQNPSIGEYGRFDLSWTGGGTNATRLSNWLDPSNSGVQTTNTTNIANLNGLVLTMTGPAAICNSATAYSVTGVPAGTAITWTSSSPGIASIAGTGTTATLTPAGRGNVTITATVNQAAGCQPITVSRTISVNAPVTISSVLQSGCNGSFQNWVLSASPTTNGSNWSWSISSLGTNSQINIYSPSSPSTNVGVKGGGAVRLNYTDACGVARQDGVTVYSTCPQFRLAVSPNPASGNMVVSMNEPLAEEKPSETEAAISPLRKIASKGQTVLSLFELNTNLPVRQWKFNETSGQRYNMNLSGLRKGHYLLQVDRDNQTQVTKVMLQ